MRILVISRRHPTRRHPALTPDNGPQFDALASQHELRLIRPVPLRGAALPVVGPIRSSRSRLSDVRGVYCPTFCEPSGPWSRRHAELFEAGVRAAAQVIARTFQPDVILGSWDYPDGWAAVRLARSLDVPVVLKAYGTDPSLPGQDRGRERVLDELRSADAVAATSRAAARTAIAMGAVRRRVHVIPDGVVRRSKRLRDRMEARRSLGEPEAGVLIVGIAEGSPKGAADLVKACAILHGRHIEFRCRLSGAHLDVGSLRALTRSRGLEHRVVVEGFLEPRAQQTWLAASNMVVYPGYSDLAAHLLRDAIECGRPIVATRVGSVPEVVPPSCGRLVLAGAVGELADAIVDVLDRPPMTDVELAGREHVSWEQSAGQLATVLQTTIERRAALRARRAKPAAPPPLRTPTPGPSERRIDAGPDVDRLRSVATRRRR